MALTAKETVSNLPNTDARDVNVPSAAVTGESTILTGAKLALALLSLYACMFLIALDQLILTTSSPRIVSDFHALDDIAWVTTAFFVGQAAFMLVFGKILTLAPVKPTLFCAMFLFEAGSAVCGAAPNMTVLLFGRTLSGVGSAGIWGAVLSIIATITALKDRARMMGFIAIVAAASSIIGPLVGGAFSDSSATWRWCFYINLPIGAIAALGILFIIPYTPAPSSKAGWAAKLDAVDPVGCLLVMGTTVCFLVPLTTGGNSFAWDSAVVCTLFPLSAVFLAALLFWCSRRGERAVLPVFLLRNRSLIGACIHGFFIWGTMMISTVYIPYYFQVIDGSSATRSALQLLPYTIVVTCTAFVSGSVISLTGDVWPFLVLPPTLAAVGYGLMYTIGVHTSDATVYGFQILAAVGTGAGMQQNMLVPQIIYHDSPSTMRIALSLVNFAGVVGRSVAISLASVVLLNDLQKEIPKTMANAPLSIQALVTHSVDAVHHLAPEYKAGAVLAYAHALRLALVVGVPLAACAMIGGLLVKRQRVSKTVLPATKGGEVASASDAEMGRVVPEKELKAVNDESAG